MKRAFSAWCTCMEARRNQRSAAEAALMRLMHGLEAAAFMAWHEHASHLADLRARVAHALHAMRHQVMHLPELLLYARKETSSQESDARSNAHR